MRNKIILSLTFLFFLLLTIYSFNIPFFWDGTFFSELSVHLFQNGFNNFIAPPEVDTGGFPMYSVYLTLVWKLFGKSLIVSHCAMLPFLFTIVYQYFKFAKRFLNNSILPFAILLLLTEPVFITQSILIGYDLILISFFLIALNTLLENKNSLYIIALILLCFSNVRGSMLCISLLLIDVNINYNKPLQKNTFTPWHPSPFSRRGTGGEVNNKQTPKLLNYLIPLLSIVTWSIYHWHKTGWFFLSPIRESTHESLLSFSMMIRQLLFIGWKISDFGRIVLWIFFISGTIYFYKKQKSQEAKILFKIVFIPLLTLSLFMIPIANPIGHKYFIVVFLCLNVGVCYLIQQLKSKALQITFLSIFCIALITGNFWLYPERLGNGWDSSLKVIPYFQLKDKMDKYIIDNNIAPTEIGTQFPLIANKQFSHLSATSFNYKNVWSGPITNNYFLFTNVINTDIPDQIENIKSNWDLVKSFSSGEVYISLYKKK